uniref:Ribonuclease H-like domain-containing protein n=1 Tax=Tanacetum cinerariifolium TaxID=118510 RepID=A0A6L2NZU5_TANCI|nr:ribonuclease H-like domain-containing protein [Tanacetum cinerariifolium]
MNLKHGVLYLVQIHEDDSEKIDLKWQLALLSMRTRKFFQKTGRKITIIGSDTAGYDKSKVECFNCHKLGYFAREFRQSRNQDSRNKNQDSSKRTVDVEETASKAMVAIDGVSFDWSYMADDKVPTNMALMDFLDSEDNCNYHQKERVVSWNNYTMVNYNYSTKKAHLSAHRNMASRTVLIKTGLRPLNTVRPVNTAHPKPTVYSARPMPKVVNTARPNSVVVNTVRANQVNAVKASTYTECVVLSLDFKLLNESQVLLRVLRKNNMYNVDLKNVAPSGDHLDKFDGKADEGYFVGYSVSNKAFRVFNSRTRIVKETMHMTFLENKPNVARSGQTWLFDINTLTKSMNYKPVIAGNQSNGSAGKEEKKDAKDLVNEDNEVLSTEEPRVNQEKDVNVNSTNNINTVKEINYSDDDEDVGAEADMTNLDSNIPVSPILTT